MDYDGGDDYDSDDENNFRDGLGNSRGLIPLMGDGFVMIDLG